MRPNRLAGSIHTVLASVLAAAAPVAGAIESPAVRVAEQAAALDEANATPAPIAAPAMTVITREEIDRSGDFSVADLLRDSVLAPFGSFRPQSGSSWQSFSGLDLRGLGTRDTLVLVDGRRIAPYALGPSGGYDLNAIPLAMVERIEITPEGASARYGTDAIGGVVNIVTRDVEGAELRIGIGEPSTTGGDLEEISATFGADTGRTRLVGGAAKNSRRITFRRHQPGGEVPNLSAYGNSYYDWNTGAIYRTPGFACDSDGFTVVEGDVCLYDLNHAAADDASIDNKSVFVRGEHAITDDWGVWFAASTANVESFGRYAPTPGDLIVEDGTPNDINAGVACGPGGCASGTTDGLPTYYFHRFAANGNRDTFVDSQVSDYAVGFRGTLGDMLDVEFGLQRGEYDAIELGRGDIVAALATAAANRGDYLVADPFATDPNVLAGMSATTSREALYVRDAAFATGRVDWTLPTGVSQMRFGVEMANEDYHDRYDSLSLAGEMLGAGVAHPAAGERDTRSAWIEWSLPLAANLHAALAGRHDRTEAGKVESTFSPKLTIAWQPLEWLGARATWGESFHAPSLHDIGRAPVLTEEFLLDPGLCLMFGCEYFVDVVTTGNPELEAETSDHWSVGVEFRPRRWLLASVDYWDVRLDKRHFDLGAQTALFLDAAGALPEGATVIRGGGGAGPVQTVITGTVNSAGLDTRGVDVRLATDFDFGGAGRLQNRLDLTRVLDYDVRLPWGEFGVEDSFAHPSLRASLANVWTLGDWELGWTVHHIGDHEGEFAPAVDAWTTHDLSVAWQAPWNATLALGATNVTDEEPELEPYDDRPYNFYLYDGAGRTVWARYTQRF